MGTNVTKEDAKNAMEHLWAAMHDKIQELCDVRGSQTERHAYLYYRDNLWVIKDYLDGTKR